MKLSYLLVGVLTAALMSSSVVEASKLEKMSEAALDAAAQRIPGRGMTVEMPYNPDRIPEGFDSKGKAIKGKQTRALRKRCRRHWDCPWGYYCRRR